MKKTTNHFAIHLLALMVIFNSSCIGYKSIKLDYDLPTSNSKKKQLTLSDLKEGDELRVYTNANTKYRFEYVEALDSSLSGYKLKYDYKEDFVQPISEVTRLDKKKKYKGLEIAGASVVIYGLALGAFSIWALVNWGGQN